jgi:hypothetical protein
MEFFFYNTAGYHDSAFDSKIGGGAVCLIKSLSKGQNKIKINSFGFSSDGSASQESKN